MSPCVLPRVEQPLTLPGVMPDIMPRGVGAHAHTFPPQAPQTTPGWLASAFVARHFPFWVSESAVEGMYVRRAAGIAWLGPWNPSCQFHG